MSEVLDEVTDPTKYKYKLKGHVEIPFGTTAALKLGKKYAIMNPKGIESKEGARNQSGQLILCRNSGKSSPTNGNTLIWGQIASSQRPLLHQP